MTCSDCAYFVNTRTSIRGTTHGECARKGKQTVMGAWILPERRAKNPFCSWGKIAEGKRNDEHPRGEDRDPGLRKTET